MKRKKPVPLAEGGGFAEDGGHEGPRTRVQVKKKRVNGKLEEWTGNYGWIKASENITHPEAKLNKGRIYVYKTDLNLEWGQKLQEGDDVSFMVYADGRGLGAEDCQLRKKPEPPAKKAKPKTAEKEGNLESSSAPKKPKPTAEDELQQLLGEVCAEHAGPTQPAFGSFPTRGQNSFPQVAQQSPVFGGGAAFGMGTPGGPAGRPVPPRPGMTTVLDYLSSRQQGGGLSNQNHQSAASGNNQWGAAGNHQLRGPANMSPQWQGTASNQLGGAASMQFGVASSNQFQAPANPQFGGPMSNQWRGAANNQFGAANNQFGGAANNQYGGAANNQYGGFANNQLGGMSSNRLQESSNSNEYDPFAEPFD
eukprot:gnl/MRDRNA2_/MRDRNA2_123122_c0_seq1.p1 gnl/MRDRNA2_/MRDRNA2_123122_c0~~gnl/MRDRNA2_/MRDRNA2_123122_c0_seq1.p1  ORF type:complete len:364 (-),score=80.58 gnl/MRDRNA2_/MRDRNA2_123122_c0_seq1:2-1093(-)